VKERVVVLLVLLGWKACWTICDCGAVVGRRGIAKVRASAVRMLEVCIVVGRCGLLYGDGG